MDTKGYKIFPACVSDGILHLKLFLQNIYFFIFQGTESYSSNTAWATG